jgi:queuine tRNA-ribosyltransferase
LRWALYHPLGNTFYLWMRQGWTSSSSSALGSRTAQTHLTDSGGFQVWSLGGMRKISEGVSLLPSPARQAVPDARNLDAVRPLLNSDIVQFDECAITTPRRPCLKRARDGTEPALDSAAG